jgi:hypothetical protein
MTKRQVQLNGLKAENSRDLKEGDVVYRKFGSQWRIYVRYVGPSGISTVILASNWGAFLRENPELLAALKKSAKPFSTINDKENNHRRLMGHITITYDDRTAKLLSYTINEEGLANKTAPVSADKEAYAALETFGVFMVNILNFAFA